MLTTYRNLCTLYYDLDKPTAPAEELAFYQAYAAAAQGPILEPMCGTGRFFIPLLEAGFNIHGFDGSSHMLTVLNEKCQQKNLNPNVWQQLAEELSSEVRYGLIFIPCASMGLILEPELVLQVIYDHLAPGGKFVFDVETMHAVPEQTGAWRGDVRYLPDGSMLFHSTCALPSVGQVGTSISRYELITEGQVVQTEVERYRIRLYRPGEIDFLLQNIGFRYIKCNTVDQRKIYECAK